MLAEEKKEKIPRKQWVFVLYVSARNTRLSKRAIQNLHDICEEYLKGEYGIQMVDIEEEPEIGKEKNIIASPTVVRELPEPLKRVIGDLSEREKALVALGIGKKVI